MSDSSYNVEGIQICMRKKGYLCHPEIDDDQLWRTGKNSNQFRRKTDIWSSLYDYWQSILGGKSFDKKLFGHDLIDITYSFLWKQNRFYYITVEIGHTPVQHGHTSVQHGHTLVQVCWTDVCPSWTPWCPSFYLSWILCKKEFIFCRDISHHKPSLHSLIFGNFFFLKI